MSQEGFLSRWSRRKVDAKVPTPVETVQLPVEEEVHDVAVIEPETPPAAVQEEEPTAEELGLPAIETLDKDSDYTGFMKEGVPELLKKQALRALWKSDPIFANLDGMNEYDEDFSKFTPLAEGVAEELKKLMKENSKPTEPEPEVDEAESPEELIQTDEEQGADDEIQPEVNNEPEIETEENPEGDKTL